jgi:WD40 repeat protein
VPQEKEDCGEWPETAVKSVEPMNKARRIKTLLVGLLIWCAGSLILWFTLPYKPKAILSAPEDLVFVAFSPNAKIIATKPKRPPAERTQITAGWKGYDPNGPIRLWDVDTGKQIALFLEEGLFIQSVLFSNDGKSVTLVSYSLDGRNRRISVFDVQTGQALSIIHQLPFPLLIFPLGVFPTPFVQARIMPLGLYPYPSFQNCILTLDGKLLFFDSPWQLENWVVVWDISTGQVRQNLDQWPLAVSADGQYCALPSVAPQSGMPFSVVLRELSTGRDVAKIQWNVSRVQFSPDGKLLVAEVFNESALGHKEVKVWDVERGKELATLNGVIWPTFSRDGKRMAGRFLGMEGPRAIKVWDTETWQELSELHQAPQSRPLLRGAISSITAGPGDKDFRAIVFDNRNVAPSPVRQWFDQLIGRKSSATGSTSTDLQVFDVVSQKTVLRLRLQESSWLRTQIGSAAILSPDGRTLALEPGAKSNPTDPISIELFNVPPDRPLAAIVLWPFLGSLVIISIGWQVHWLRRKYGAKARNTYTITTILSRWTISS